MHAKLAAIFRELGLIFLQKVIMDHNSENFNIIMKN